MGDAFDLDRDEREQVKEFEKPPTSVIYEAIRRQGEHELSRTASALWWSGVVAGIAISTSVLGKGFLTAVMPEAGWASVVSNFGYCAGFLIVILGRMQLFTENTITPILPLFLDPTAEKFLKIGRLWGIVFLANMAGCLVAALVISHGRIIPPDRLDGVLEISRHFAEASTFEHFSRGIPAGFMIAALVWILPRMTGAGETLIIIILTYMIALGDLSHVVAGATELFVVMFHGEISVWQTVFAGILPALAGNVLGGTGIFAALTYAQVRQEI
ncbi:formate/nitrite transporter family protein [Roseisalinus antarcticus]|uniref:Inner membrane protein YfdC n=1 Tax=Roseisalinus antarcticus TaxID=254357 RepID=A0A1Y5T5L5_9RHOB|nr:formate/nitrite transporter family protein [Roseisalinus antarcticus]SLN53043.1 Inner membrane protein YfdC [Roseisalinus antarcticus]